jgi:hypothetical protein
MHEPRGMFKVLGRLPACRFGMISISSPLGEIIEARGTKSSVELAIKNARDFVFLFVDDCDWRGRFYYAIGNLRISMRFQQGNMEDVMYILVGHR